MSSSVSNKDQHIVEQSSWFDSSNFRSSLTAHVITALVVAIVVGAGAAIAAYFLTQHVILWTAVAGGGSFALIGVTTFVALRCCLGDPKPEISVGTITLDVDDEPGPNQKPNVQPKKTLDERELSDSIPPPNNATPSAVVSTQAVCLVGVPYEVKKNVAVDRASLPDLISTLDEKFFKRMQDSGIVYYDPTNELPIPLARLYQEMLTHPTCGDKRAVLLKLLAAELLDIYVQKDSIEFVYKCLYGLDANTVAALGKEVPTTCLKGIQLEFALKHYQTAKESKEAARAHSKIDQLLTSELGKGKFYLGAALDNGECLFHAMAQQLSLHTGKSITAKMLRMECAEHLAQELECSEELLKEITVSSRELVEQGMSETKTVSWGGSEHMQIIADAYDVEFKIYEVNTDRVIEREAFNEVNPKTGLTDETPAVYQDVLTVEVKEIKPKSKLTDRTPVLRLALMKSHFFPVWPKVC